MATTEQLASLRRAGDILVDDSTYTETLLATLYDTYGLNRSALIIWREKMAAYAKLVNVTEAGSSRSMSDLWSHAKDMVALYQRLVDSEPVPGTEDLDGMAFTVEIVR